MFKYVLYIIFLFYASIASSQSIQRSTFFSASGNYADIGTLQLQSNIGELSVLTYSGAQNMLTQGFVQPEQTPASIISLTNKVGVVKLFPNPVSSHLFIELTSFDDIEIAVFDLLGKKQSVELVGEHSLSRSNYDLNFGNLRSGIYFVRITSIHEQFSKTFKINKI